jgi:hypothetical protein
VEIIKGVWSEGKGRLAVVSTIGSNIMIPSIHIHIYIYLGRRFRIIFGVI